MNRLNSPIQIGKLTAKNRLVMPPVATYLSHDGAVSPKMLEYYGARAESGVGLIITEHSFICTPGMARRNQLSFAKDADKPGLRKLAEIIHQGGALAFAQLNHAGSGADIDASRLPAVGPSAVSNPAFPNAKAVPNEMTREEIADVVQKFADAARRAASVGFDGVEIHSAHGYLLNQFYSPITNRRLDDYGGALKNRLRFHVEVLLAVREAVGPDFPVAMRLGACDDMAGGITAKDSAEAAKVLEEAGLNLLDISGGMCRYIREGHEEEGYFAEESVAVKRTVSIPVLLTGGILHRETAEAFLTDGAADLIGMGRPMLKDPNWARHILEG